MCSSERSAMDTAIFNSDANTSLGIAMFNLRSYGSDTEMVLAAVS